MITSDAGLPPKTSTVTAVRWTGSMDTEGFPPDAAWETVPGVQFDWDWQGANPDPTRETQVRLLWTPETLFIEFRAKYHSLTVYNDADSRGWRNKLWDRDVCELFVQSDPSQPRKYQEFEVAPNGNWIDLDINLDGGEHGKRDLTSGLKRRASIDEAAKTWRAVLALAMKSLVAGKFDPSKVWRVNFFRVEGTSEPRFYASWQPTKTPVPQFHVPEVFGRLVFAGGGEK
ncbi:MAG: carbohydrate-binding family 9-like protein [Acidobacteria bacterium]|nr:carbohydrate-binding family 9-like protein [Acidobacteriota bacterium]